MMAKTAQTLDEARFARFSTDYACHNTIQHWQLRDLIEYDDETRMIYTACGAKIVGFNLRTRTALDVVPAPPRGHRAPTGPTTFAVKGGCLATGTDKGELSVYDMEPDGSLKSKPRFQSTITRQNEVLNNLNIIPGIPGTSRPKLYTCGNDRTVRCYNLNNMQCMEEIKQPVAVNCSAEDPTGNKLITLGDDSIVRLYCRDQTGMLRESTQLWADSTDRVNACGMCAHWHPWGNTFATAFQCGQLLVWDVRSKQRVAQLRTHGRAIRSVKYSSEPNDLLAFGEHEQAFHLVDARNYSARQTLHVSVSSIGISGIAFDATASRLFVGVDCKGIQEWSIDSAARRSFCSSSSA